jgi:serine/threonine-protein kinase RsbT
MDGEPLVQPVRREVDVYIAVSRGRELAKQIGFDEIDRTRIEIVILELTRNILVHAGEGQLTLQGIAVEGRRGMLVQASDTGPGIADVELALRDGYSTAHTLGAGLPGVKRLMDEFSVETTVGAGTSIRAVRWLTAKRGGRR